MSFVKVSTIQHEDGITPVSILGGIKLAVLDEEPTTPQEGVVVIADRITWDPLSKGSGGSYLTWYNGSAWKALGEQ